MIVVLFYAFNLTAQDILWKKNYGLNTADDFGQSVIEGNDGNIVIVGYTGYYGAGGLICGL
ncbi:MAG: hypothetical protein IPH11_12920 [Ignavibacteriales bacterium]|nr:hypothetical protein [Ignavibacteriales bacterium]